MAASLRPQLRDRNVLAGHHDHILVTAERAAEAVEVLGGG